MLCFLLANDLNINELPKQVNRKAGENKRRLDTDDLLHLYCLLDVNKVTLPTYVAADLTRIPPSVNSGQSDIKNLILTVGEIHSHMAVMKQQLETLCSVCVECTGSTLQHGE